MLLNQKRSKVFYGWWVVFGCSFFGLYMAGAVFYGFTAVFEPIAKEFGWSYAQISIAASLRGLEMGILAPLLGVLVDRFGPRRLMLCGTLVTGFGLILLSHITSLGMFYVAFLVIAIGISPGGGTVVMTAAANWFRKNVAMATGIVASGFGLGGFLVPLVTMSVDRFGWRSAMVGIGLTTWIIGVPLSLLVRHKPEQYGYLPDGEPSDGSVVGEGLILAQGSEVSISTGEALKSLTFWHIALAAGCHMMTVNAVMTHVMPYLSSIGITRSVSSLVAAALPVASICGRLGFGWLGDRLDKKRVAAAGFVLVTLGLLSLYYVPAVGMWLFVPFLILFGIGWGGNVTIRVALLREYFGRSKFGTILGFTSGIMMVGSISGAPIAGWVFDIWGSYKGAWFAFAILTIVASIVIAYTPPFGKTIEKTRFPAKGLK